MTNNLVHPRLAAFVPFQLPPRCHAPAPDPRLTLGKDRRFVLNDAAYAALGRPARVALYWDGAARVIALRACGDTSEGLAVSRMGRAQWGVAGRSFCAAYDIGGDRSHRLPVTIEEGILFADAPEEPEDEGLSDLPKTLDARP